MSAFQNNPFGLTLAETLEDTIVIECQYATVYGDRCTAWTYAHKHFRRFGPVLRSRPATEDDAQYLDWARLTYTFRPEAPARIRFEQRQKERAEKRGRAAAERRARKAAARRGE